jgi:hypothetical protein
MSEIKYDIVLILDHLHDEFDPRIKNYPRIKKCIGEHGVLKQMKKDIQMCNITDLTNFAWLVWKRSTKGIVYSYDNSTATINITENKCSSCLVPDIIKKLCKGLELFSDVRNFKIICNLPTKTKTDSVVTHSFYNSCSICLEKFKEDEQVKELSCKHLFHPACINKWLKEKESCPTCRTPF